MSKKKAANGGGLKIYIVVRDIVVFDDFQELLQNCNYFREKETAAAELDEKAAEKSKIYEIALKTIDDLKQKVAEMENEVLFAKSVKASEDCINVSMMARILFMNGVDTSERKLFTWLRDNGWLEEVGGIKNVPTMKALENGYMVFNECAVTTNVGKVHLSFTPKITGKGQEYFTQYFLGDDHE